MRLRLPDGSTAFLAAGAVAVSTWLVGTVLGRHPDGGLLGFSAGMFAVWSAMRKEGQRRDEDRRKRRRDEDDDEEDDRDHGNEER